MQVCQHKHIKIAKSGKAKVCLPLEGDIPHGLILCISRGGRLLPLLQILGGGAQLALLRFAGTGVVPVWSQLFLPQGLQLKRKQDRTLIQYPVDKDVNDMTR